MNDSLEVSRKDRRGNYEARHPTENGQVHNCGRARARGENTCPCEHLGGAVTILADQVLELRIRQGQVHIVRKPRIEDDEDREFRATNAPYLGDDV